MLGAIAMVGPALVSAVRAGALRELLRKVGVQRLGLDLRTAEMDWRFAGAAVYEKFAVVRARRAEPGEVVETVLANGRVETSNVAGDNDFVLTNPDGEQYLIGSGKLAARYVDLGDGRYRAKGMVRAFRNPTGREISITAPWGEEQRGGPRAMLAVVYDPQDPGHLGADRYIIGAAEFRKTYRKVSRRTGGIRALTGLVRRAQAEPLRQLQRGAEGWTQQGTWKYVGTTLRRLGLDPWWVGRYGVVVDVGDPQASGGVVLWARGDPNAHAALLAAAAMLHNAPPGTLPGRVRLVFEPIEPSGDTQAPLVDGGVLREWARCTG